jgi:1-acyl-sn-glycerol-3-phosphate acyltransferase
VAQTQLRRIFVDNVDKLRDLNPDRGVVLCANHRSFFDQYLIMLSIWEGGCKWPQRIYFPVRSNFFYDQPLGLFINMAVGGGVMYPPIFRDTAKASLNKEAVERIISFLKVPGNLVGMHPEGTRGKGPDPYEMLPAQPGVGQLVLQAKPIVLPVFINGLSNDFLGDVKLNFQRDIRRTNPVIITFGDPVDYAEFTQRPPRAALYKKTADFIRERILALRPRERELRAACLAGEIPDDHPSWFRNLRRRWNW